MGYVSVVDLSALAETYSAFENQKLLNSPHETASQPSAADPPAARQEAGTMTNISLAFPAGAGGMPVLQHPHICSTLRQQALEDAAGTSTGAGTGCSHEDMLLSHRNASVDVHEFAANGGLVAHFLVSSIP